MSAIEGRAAAEGSILRPLWGTALGLVVACCGFGQTYTISTFAGGAGLQVNVPGPSASLVPTYGVALDGAGNVFFTCQHAVLRLDASTGLLTLVAGGADSGFSGDNGPAASALLNNPRGVAVDSTGNLYIADSGNYRVREVSKGTITTVAGNGTAFFGGDNGPAVSAQLDPVWVAVDSSGNLYISDPANNRVRKVSERIITTVAGNGTAGFSGDNGPAVSAALNLPGGIALDFSGNLYIADSNNFRIRKVSGGTIATVAGNGTNGSGGDGGPALSAQFVPVGLAADPSGNLYISDPNAYRVRRVSNGTISTLAGNGSHGSSVVSGPATRAALMGPLGVGVDPSGNVYFADDIFIRQVWNGGIVTVAGNGLFGLSGDNGPATSAQVYYPEGVALDGAGNVYIADPYNNRVRAVSGGTIVTAAGTGNPGFSGDGGWAAIATLNAPSALAADYSGDLYIADTGNHCIRKVSGGIIATIAGNGTAGFSGDNGPAIGAQLNMPEGIALDSSRNLYIADTANNRVRKVSNGIITTVAGTGVYGFGGDNGPATSAMLSAPGGLAVDSAGNLYVVDTNNGRIRRVSNGIISTVAGNGAACCTAAGAVPATSQQLSPLFGIAVDSLGSLYVTNAGDSVAKVSNGVITTIAGQGVYGSGGGFSGDNGPATAAQLNEPYGLAVDSAGNIYVADAGNNRIRLLVPSGASCSASVGPTSFSAAALGGPLNVTIQTGASCAWAVQSLPAWITYSGSALGMGPAAITLVLAANTGAARSGTVSVAGIPVSITQAGGAVLPSLSAVTNAATNLAGPVAPGEIVVLWGSGLGPTQLVKASVGGDGLYDAQLSGTTVSFNGTPAPMIYTSATQVAAVVPYEVTGGTAQVAVTYQGLTTGPLPVPIAASAPGIFTYDASGAGQAAAIDQDGVTINGPTAPAKVGDIVSLYVTGEGQTSPAGVDGKPAAVPLPHPNLPVVVMIGGMGAQVIYAGGAPGEVAGLMQVNAQIPSGIQTGNWVPVSVIVGMNPSQSGVTIAVH
jgi:uncharacterized protein (TIGR03437 family)